jgi:uncharacterized protein YdbL (DUF1318 family)
MKRTSIITLTALFIISFASTMLHAEGIKERLAKRLPAINKMKEEGLIGENNKGYLEARKETSDANKKIIDAENIDRKKIYQMLAKKTGQTVEVIASRRALQIAEKTKAGVWLQKPDGTWYKK